MNGRPVSLVLAILSCLVVGACMPVPATEQGKAIFDLYKVFVAGSIVVAIVVWVPATWAVLRYRRVRREAVVAEELPPQIRGSVRLELLWTALPSLTVLVLFVLTLLALAPVEARREGSVDLRITAFRWGWQFVVNGNVRVAGSTGENPEVVLPVGEPVHVTLTSSDVVHSFYVPAFLYKHDANPGREQTFDLLIATPGTYGGQCAEFCGTFHSRMPFSIKAVSPQEYRQWIAGQAKPSP